MTIDHMNIPIARTNLLPQEIDAALSPLKSGWLVQGPKVAEFEQKWSAFTGAEHSVAVTSCTSGMHLGLLGTGFSASDSAIVPAFTWISTANVVEHVGGNVIFCDIELDTFNIDVEHLASLEDKNSKAILPVHLFGLPADMSEVLSFARHTGMTVIEDSACGFGARYDGQHVGAIGNLGVFSFHPRKAITTGEGGMITTNDEKIANLLRCLRDHGATVSDLQRHLGPKPYLLAEHCYAGFNQRMTDIQASIGSAQMDRAIDIVKERRRLARRYNEAFAGLDWLRTPTDTKSGLHGYQSYPCLFFPDKVKEALRKGDYSQITEINERRNFWMEKLQSIGISTRPATHAVHMLDYYKKKYGLTPQDFPNAFAADQCSISLPLFHGMSSLEQEYIIDRVTKARF